jgi:hypothetical protein
MESAQDRLERAQRAARRTAIILALVALAFYLGFILMQVES